MFTKVTSVQPLRVIRVPPIAVLVLALVLTAAATTFSLLNEQSQRRALALELGLRLDNEIQDRMTAFERTLFDTRSFLNAAPHFDQRSFAHFVKELELPRSSGVSTIGVIRRVRTSELSEFLREMRRENGAEFKIKPVLDTDEHMIIVSVEPPNERRKIFEGFDVMSEPSRREAMERARDSGLATLTRPTKLLFDNGLGLDFLLYIPIYRPGATPNDTAARREALTGFLYVPFRVRELLKPLIEAALRSYPKVGVSIHYGKDLTSSSLLFSNEQNVPEGRTRVSHALTSTIGNAPWTLSIAADARSLNEHGWPTHNYVLTIGLLISILIYVLARQAHQYANGLESSRSLLSMIADGLPALVAYVDLDGRYLYANETYREWFQVDPEQLIGEAMGARLGPRWEKFFQPLLNRALKGEPLEFEHSLEFNGRWRVVRSQYVPDRDRDGKVNGVVVLGSDITDQKAFQDRLRDERRVSELVNEIGLSLQTDLDLNRLTQRIVCVATELTGADVGAYYERSQEAETRTQYQLGAISGVHKDVLSHDGAAFIRSGLEFAFNAGRLASSRRAGAAAPQEVRGPITLDSINALWANAERPLSSYLIVPVVARSGEILGGLFFGHTAAEAFSERTEKLVTGVAAQASVAIDNARLYTESQAINRIKDEFLATLSHELRTPLNVILGYSELLREDDLPESLRPHVEAIYRNAQAQGRLIGDLLDISAIITGKLTFQPVRLRTLDWLQAAVESVRFTADAKSVRLERSLDRRGIELNGDPTRLQQIVWNLLSNAVKFTPSGGVVTVNAEVIDLSLVISISDTGIGIHSEFLPYVFDRFRQEDSGRSRRFGGLGLGLSIVRQLVELHGGSIKVASAGKDQGSVFTLTLPLQPSLRPVRGLDA